MDDDLRRYFNYFVLLIIAFFPWINYILRRFHIPGSTIWDDIFILSIFVLSIAFHRKRFFTLFKNITVIWGILFAIITLFSFYINNYMFIAFVHEFRLFFEPFLLFLIILLLTPIDEVEFYIKCLILSSFLLAIVGIYQYIIKVPSSALWVDKELERASIYTRAFSIVGSPNVLAAYLEIALPLSLIFIIKKKGIISKLIYSVAFTGTLFGLLVTFGRAAWLSSSFSIFAGFMGYNPLIGTTFIIISVIIAVFIPVFRLRITTLFSKEYSNKSLNFGGRLFRWKQGILNASNHPWIGSGLGTFGGSASQKYGYFAGISMDSVYIKTLAETGWLGLTAFVLWVSWEVGQLFYKYYTKRNITILFIAVSLFSILLNMFTENLFDTWGISINFWGLLAIGEILSNEK